MLWGSTHLPSADPLARFPGYVRLASFNVITEPIRVSLFHKSS